jgi:hypothetical protein
MFKQLPRFVCSKQQLKISFHKFYSEKMCKQLSHFVLFWIILFDDVDWFSNQTGWLIDSEDDKFVLQNVCKTFLSLRVWFLNVFYSFTNVDRINKINLLRWSKFFMVFFILYFLMIMLINNISPNHQWL